ncbi:MAG TPA: elongation factor P [Planctomycetes bacterium]|nr:elongation factor P [Planctomycetota bacterium]
MQAKEIKPGAVVVYQQIPVLIETIQVQAPSARGAATLYKFRGRNLLSKQKMDITLKGGESLEAADFERRPVKLMYTDGQQAHFLDQGDFNQFAIDREIVLNEMQYVTEELEGILALIYNDECVGIQLPSAVELTVTECDPGVKGNSATHRTKPATLETGLIVQVPEYLAMGQRIKIDTRTGEFLSRS